jgi:hypothetical protein
MGSRTIAGAGVRRSRYARGALDARVAGSPREPMPSPPECNRMAAHLGRQCERPRRVRELSGPSREAKDSRGATATSGALAHSPEGP